MRTVSEPRGHDCHARRAVSREMRLATILPKGSAHHRQKDRQRRHLGTLTSTWGSSKAVALYLDRCQVDTPHDVVAAVWKHVGQRRKRIAKVIDFGAGDGRFARAGDYEQYVGYEIDPRRCLNSKLPECASLVNACAFSDSFADADICIGNPPFVRNQDLPQGWRRRAASVVKLRTGVQVSGLANAWQYFTFHALASTKSDGLIALVIPYEWVSRPSAKALRDYIKSRGWEVSVYRLRDETFQRVLTTSSITIIDKSGRSGKWQFFIESDGSPYEPLESASGGKFGLVHYSTRREVSTQKIHVKRGLSPGTQQALTLTEGERIRAGLKVNVDVVPCVTSLRALGSDAEVLTTTVFRKYFRDTAAKCWLVRTDRPPSERLSAFLKSTPPEFYQTSTCLSRDVWWKFTMPQAPSILVASGFRGKRPKVLVNEIGAVAVGGVSGIYGVARNASRRLVRRLRSIRVASRVVPHSNGLLKLEIGQLNTVIRHVIAAEARARS
jgi:hypothetical protein